MKTVLVLAASLLISVTAFAETNKSNNKKEKESESVALVENVNTLQLSGSVVDEKNKETLAGATIVVDGKKYYSDLDGNFFISDVTPGKYQMVVELISYEPVSLEVVLNKNQNLNIGLLQK
ncbi:MAG: carboxypeptidase-like regulatory domain-containing protein [Fermentimonas sp.]|nr:carboxypeptidase-like regulatory domain-containing protein [Fermentimonas sp.]